MKAHLVLAFGAYALVTSIYGCTAQEDPKVKIVSEAYEPCCSSDQEVNFKFNGLEIFIPNAFTPNGDGINDYWYPIYDTTSALNPYVLYFTIYDSDDIDKKQRIFHATQILFSDLENTTFGGTILNGDNPLYGTPWKGQFYYEFRMVVGNDHKDFAGKACSIICDEESPIFKDKEGCFFPAQVAATASQGDNKLPNKETTCFER